MSFHDSAPGDVRPHAADASMADDNAQDTLRRVWGYDSFRPGQEEIVRAILDGSDALAVMPTGGGKSLCYQIPSILRDGVGLIVSPLIALMADQVDALKALGVRAERLDSSMRGRPTAASRARFGELRDELAAIESRLDRLLAEELPAFEQAVDAAGLGRVIVR